MEKKIPTILLVEEGGDYLNSTFRLLLAFSVHVKVLENARQAWKILFANGQKLTPDLVILPGRLDDLTACDLVRKMRSKEDTREIPAIVTFDSFDEQEYFQQCNFPLSFPFVKPLTFADLVHAIPALEESSSRLPWLRPPQEITASAF